MKELLDLFFTFAKVGVMTFGGGMAMLPMLQKEIVEKKKWATEEEVADYFAIGQCTPGIIAVNTATFIGHKQRGVAGGIAATLGVVFPSVVIITILAAFLSNFADIPAVQHAFAGIRVCVCALVINAAIKIFKKGVKDWKVGALYAAIVALSLFTKLSPIIYVVAAAVCGILIKRFEEVKK